MLYQAAQLDDEMTARMDALMLDYYHTTAASEGLPPYDFDWNTYRFLQDQGQLLVLAAERKALLCGFVLYIVAPHLHHKTMLVADCDSLSVSRHCRGEGIGRTLVEAAEPLLRAKGVTLISHRYRTCYNAEPLFPKLGFSLWEHSYVKELK